MLNTSGMQKCMGISVERLRSLRPMQSATASALWMRSTWRQQIFQNAQLS